MDQRYRQAIDDLADRVQSMADPSKVNMYKIHTRTARMNREKLLRWKEEMDNQQQQTKDPRERVYLVVSDLRLLAMSENYSGQGKWHSAHTDLPHRPFLHERDINSLHENHWAIEIHGRYYELVRVHGDRSKFSSEHRVEENGRQILARIFLGTTHLGHHALDAIGDAVISTQLDYQLTKDNCHRFVKVFTTLVLCPNHVANTTCVPFDVEEHLKTRHLNQRTGKSGSRMGKLEGEEETYAAENYLYRVSSQIGEGVEWKLLANGPFIEFRRTLRELKQKTNVEERQLPWTRVGDPNSTYLTTVYWNEFEVYQEETSYFMTVDLELTKGLSRCQYLDANPYLCLVRFEKISHYTITQKKFRGRYRPTGLAYGITTFPYGTVWKNGFPEHLKSVSHIRDPSGVLRDEYGNRVEKPKSTWQSLVANFEDFFGRTSKASYSYSYPTWDLLVLMSKQQAVRRTFPWVLIGAAGLSVLARFMTPAVRRRPSRATKSRHSHPSSARSRPPIYESDENYVQDSVTIEPSVQRLKHLSHN